MLTIPVLTTPRLVLRPFCEDDVAAVERLLATPHIAEYTLNFPWPYPPGAALVWIRRHGRLAEEGRHLQWAITREPDDVIGAIGIFLEDEPRHGDIGYWVGVDHWNKGYATEATRAVIAYGFDVLDLPRVQASCFVENVASARVLEKAGMLFESDVPGGVVKDGEPRDVQLYAIAQPGARS